MRLRILLADDHEIVREGLRSLIKGQPYMEVVAEAETGREAVLLARRHRPDVIIMDIGMPDLNGMDATILCIEAVPEVKVIALSMHSDTNYVLGMLKAGAKGFILKEGAFKELIQAIRVAEDNQIYLSPKVTGVIVSDCIPHVPPEMTPSTKDLTVKEREVLQMIAEGHPTRRIAEALNVSVKTVEARRKCIMEKLGLHSVAELTKYAIRVGLTTADV
ncbi:MAG: response regulator transcription factor [Desulfobacterales bacterium]|jgi:DNA-binding NarL/FixJ family response regulator|nr:response regulator transcription factor [Desulfobacterales bacterium]